MCPKTKNLSKQVCEFAVAQAILNYNVGYKLGYLGKELGITKGKNTKKFLRELDKKREQAVKSRPRKKKKTTVDPSYGAGEH